ncbi:hypothetical protein Lal_00021337 [Lupinus albus]|nr:hypothetical protein Lal_00021337 [Lupinus albus]
MPNRYSNAGDTCQRTCYDCLEGHVVAVLMNTRSSHNGADVVLNIEWFRTLESIFDFVVPSMTFTTGITQLS